MIKDETNNHIPEENWEQKRSDMREYHIDTFVMGDDWKGKFDYLRDEGVEVVYLPRTPEISTSQIKADLFGDKLLRDKEIMWGYRHIATAFSGRRKEAVA